ncbi:MAG: hypothetical protein HC828_21635 [Blastochloris sp.]|nr:hypothetical protein [Blastochloris sp.]
MIALMLAVLNPLACLIHCAAAQRAGFAHAGHAHHLHHDQHSHAPDDSSSPESIAPRAFYESAPITTGAFVVLMAALLPIAAALLLRLPQIYCTPPTPPPRLPPFARCAPAS